MPRDGAGRHHIKKLELQAQGCKDSFSTACTQPEGILKGGVGILARESKGTQCLRLCRFQYGARVSISST